MKKIYKVEAVYYCGTLGYAVYQKRFLWGWKCIGKFVDESDARKVAEELANPPTYFETKKK